MQKHIDVMPKIRYLNFLHYVIFCQVKLILEDLLHDRRFALKTLSPSNMEHILKTQKAIQILKGKTSKGRAVFVIKPAEWDWSKWGPEDLLRLAVLLLRDLMMNFTAMETVVPVCVVDCKGYSHKDFKYWVSLIFTRSMWFNGYPTFRPEVHCVNCSKIVQILAINILRLAPNYFEMVRK